MTGPPRSIHIIISPIGQETALAKTVLIILFIQSEHDIPKAQLAEQNIYITLFVKTEQDFVRQKMGSKWNGLQARHAGTIDHTYIL